jgi:rSAM/selenodomain-associated transferase 1
VCPRRRKNRQTSFRRFSLSGHGLDLPAGADVKVFWFFSSEKNVFLKKTFVSCVQCQVTVYRLERSSGHEDTERAPSDPRNARAAPMTTGIAVMAKAPRAGEAKTRLCPALSATQAAGLGAAFLQDITENLRIAAASAPIVPYVAFAPAGTESLFDGLLAPGTRLLLADGSLPAPAGVERFGRCLHHALHDMFSLGHTAACVLNADSPTLPTRLLLQAEAALALPGDRVVIGAAEDGGYYLLGMKRLHANLLSRIDWSTGQVAAQTRERAGQAGLTLIELDPWYDVDEPDMLDRLIDELTGAASPDAFHAPHSAACLNAYGLLTRTRALAGTAA